MSKEGEEDSRSGSQLVQQHNQEIARRLQRFINGLDLLRGSCILCQFDGNGKRSSAEHLLDQCPSPDKWRFLSAKQAAIQQGRQQRGGWLARYRACYGCGNIQTICPQQGRGGCRYKDIVMPLCWKVFDNQQWQEAVLGRIAGGVAASREEGIFMLWLGEEASVFGEAGTNLAIVACRAVEAIISGDIG